MPRARFKVGRFLDTENGEAVFALPNDMHRSYCEEVTKPVEDALSAKFGAGEAPADHGSRRAEQVGDLLRAVTLRVKPSGPPDTSRLCQTSTSPICSTPTCSKAETEPAGQALSPAERLKLTFPGAQEVSASVAQGPLQPLIDELGRLPGIGPKSAQRLAFYLLKVPYEERDPARGCHRLDERADHAVWTLLQRRRRWGVRGL